MKSRLLLGGLFFIMAFILGAALIMRSAGMPIESVPPAQTTLASTTAASSSTQTSYTIVQVAQHNNAGSCWAAINGSVYDLTNWINQHPGGPEHILAICGTDGSAAFNAQHGGQPQPAAELKQFLIGPLAS